MIRPLTLVALCYAAGILAGRILEPPPVLFLLAGAGLFALAAMSERWRTGLVLGLFALLGAAHQGIEAQPLAPADLRHVVGAEPRIAGVRGRMIGPPTLRLLEIDGEVKERSTARIEVSAIRLGGEWTPAAGRLVAAVSGNLEGRFHGGQLVDLTGVVTPPPGPKAPGLFDHRAFLENQGIHYLLRLDDAREWTLAPGNTVDGPGFSERFIAWAKRTLARGLPEDEATSLLWAMTLGWKAALSDEVAEPFMKSGTLHVFAISGLHIALIAGILVKLAVLCRVPRRWCFVPVMALLWFYVAATGWQSSAVRSAVMMSVVLLGWALNRPPDLLNSLFVAALCILAWEPLQLFQASFQLSFLVVLAIALVTPAVEHRFRQWFEPDAFLARDLRTWWQRGRDGVWRWFAKAFAVSFAAWIGSLPLTAHYFHLLTPGSLLANLVVVPLSGFALAASVASLLCGAWFPALAEVFNHASWACMYGMVAGSHAVADLPGASWFVPAPTLFEMGLFGVSVVALGFGRLGTGKLRVIGASAAALLVVCLGLRVVADRRNVRLTVLPLSGGHSVHVDARGRGSDLLVDTGEDTSAELVLRPFLRAHGVNRLPRLALTHGDVRHVGGAVGLAEAFRIGEVDVGSAPFRSPVYRRVVATLETNHCPVVSVKPDDSVAGWTVLHPAADDRFTQADDGALVLLREIHGLRWLLLSDLGRAGQDVLAERFGDGLRADVVVSGLPVKGEPLGEGLLRWIRPRLIVVADAELPANERASPELKARLANWNCPVLFTRTEGAVTATVFEDGRCDIETMSGNRLRLDPAAAPRP